MAVKKIKDVVEVKKDAVVETAAKEVEKKAEKAVEKAAVKAEKTVAKAAKAAKAADKAPAEKKVVAAAKKAVKKAEKAVDTVAKKAVKTVKKAETKDAKATVVLQFAGAEFKMADVLEAAKKDFAANNTVALKTITLYVKPEDGAAYYVANGDITGKVNL
jgi:hypothetical protein